MKARHPIPAWVLTVITDVAARHGVERRDILGTSRRHRIVRARNEAFYLIRKTPSPVLKRTASFPEIGRWFGDRDHTTVMYGARRHADIHGLVPVSTFNAHGKIENMRQRLEAARAAA